MKANKVYLSRLKRGFKDKQTKPVGCKCSFACAQSPDVFFIMIDDCKVHDTKINSYNYWRTRFNDFKDFEEVSVSSKEDYIIFS